MAARGDGPPRVRLLAVGQGRRARTRRSTRRRSSACAASRSRCGRTSPTTASASPACRPGFVRDAGMFADSGAPLPPGVGTEHAGDVAAAIVRAIERNRAEVDVAPLALRAGARLAGARAGARRGRCRQAARLDRGRPRRSAPRQRRASAERRCPSRTRARAAPAACSRRPRARVALTFVAGGAISLQSYLNGRLGRAARLGHGRRGDQQPRRDARRRSRSCSPRGAIPRAIARAARARAAAAVAVHRRAFGGAALVLVSAAAAPEVGVALLTVAVVCGSTGGSVRDRRRRARAGGTAAGHRAARSPACCWRSPRR